MFTARSRYASVANGVYAEPGGRQVPFKGLRRIPADAPINDVHVVGEQERLDLVAHAHYGDSEQFWRICDVNRGMWPDDLLAVAGRRLLVPLPG